MWDVKQAHPEDMAQKEARFYLNYVGCKVTKSELRRLLMKKVLSELCGM